MAIIHAKDELITYDTALLARQKGFNAVIFMQPFYRIEKHRQGFGSRKWIEENFDSVLLRPTQSLLQRWLRSKHDILVLIESRPTLQKRQYRYTIDDGVWPCKENNGPYLSYEEALEYGLQAALKLIKTE